MGDSSSFPVVLFVAVMIAMFIAVVVAVALDSSRFRRWRRVRRRAREAAAGEVMRTG